MTFLGRDLVFVDTETDGLTRDAQIWEIALISQDETFHAMIPIDTTLSDPASLVIGGFYERHPMSDDALESNVPLVSEREVANTIQRMTENRVLVGANVAFDQAVMTSLLNRHGYDPMWHYHLLDIEAYALGHLAGRGISLPTRWTSDDIAALCGVEPLPESERHTALGDTRWVKRWWEAVQPATS